MFGVCVCVWIASSNMYQDYLEEFDKSYKDPKDSPHKGLWEMMCVPTRHWVIVTLGL